MSNNRIFCRTALIGLLLLCLTSAAEESNQLPNLSQQNPASRFTVTDLVWGANPGDASICLWGDDKLAAMSFTVDDNCYGNVDWWMQTAETYGFKLTWFLITDRITLGDNAGFNGTWAQWAAVQAAGHDISSHTAWHLHTELPEWTGIDDEYRISKEQIETNITGYTCETLAYPGGANSYLNNRTNAAVYYAAARGGIGSGFNRPDTIDYMAVKNMGWPTGNFTTNVASANPNSLFNSSDLRYYRGWAIYLNHLVNDYNDMTPMLSYIDENRSRVWFCTFTEGIKYGQERDTATLTVISNTAGRITMTLTDLMLDSRFDYPLTLKVRISNAWNGAAATQAGVPVETTVVEHNGDKYALVKAVPDQGEIALMPGDAVTFSAAPLSGWAPLEVTFTDTSSFSGITNRFWDFGDGATTNTTAATVSHVYISAGIRTVQLVISTAESSETNTQANLINISVPAVPSAAFSASPASGSLPLAVTFADTSIGSITNRHWDFGDGTVTNTLATSVAHTYTVQGSYTVALIASGPAGAGTNTQVDVVTVTAPAPPSVSFGLDPASGTAPLTVTFTDSSTGSITNRFWDFGDGNSTNTAATSLVHTYVSEGTYTVQLTVSGSTGSATNTQADAVTVTASTGTSTGALVHLDIHTSFNYDGFVTGEEIAYATGLGKTVPNAIGDHADDYVSVRPGNGYSHLVDTNAPTYQGILPDGIVDDGNFELAKGLVSRWGVSDGDTPVPNSVARFYDGISLIQTATINLPAADQKKYATLNLLVNGSRYSTTAGPFSATLSVKYVGDANWYTIWTETAQIGEVGGVFGGEYNGGASSGNSWQSSDWTAVQVSDDGVTKVVGGLTLGGSGNSYMYKLTTPAVLDSAKTLESFKMDATTYNKSRVNEFQLFAASAQEAVSASANGDADGDGLPDEWEMAHFGGNANPEALASNGVNTIREAYIAGLDPTNPQSVFAVSNDWNILRWNATSGRVYSVYGTTNLLNSFQPLETNILWPQNSWTGQVSGSQGGDFYELRVDLAP